MKKTIIIFLIIICLLTAFTTAYAFEKYICRIDILLDDYVQVDTIKVTEVYENEGIVHEIDSIRLTDCDETKVKGERLVKVYPRCNEFDGVKAYCYFNIVLEMKDDTVIVSDLFYIDDTGDVEIVFSTGDKTFKQEKILSRKPEFVHYMLYLFYLFIGGILIISIKCAAAGLLKVKPIKYVVRAGFIVNILLKVIALIAISYLAVDFLVLVLAVLVILAVLEAIVYFKKYAKLPKKKLIIFISIINAVSVAVYSGIYLLFNIH